MTDTMRLKMPTINNKEKAGRKEGKKAPGIAQLRYTIVNRGAVEWNRETKIESLNKNFRQHLIINLQYLIHNSCSLHGCGKCLNIGVSYLNYGCNVLLKTRYISMAISVFFIREVFLWKR